MKTSIFLAIAFCLALSFSTAAQAQEKCFANDGLKDGHKIQYTVSGKSISGEFKVARDFDTDNAETYPFKGTISGTTLSVKFDGEAPDSLPVSPAAKRWTLVAGVLRVTLYGKNYVTNKWGNYAADYKSCASDYDTARAIAKRVTFAKGSTFATFPSSFTAKDQKKSFLLGLRKGQRLSVEAIGCGISFFYPNKTPYEEGTAVDTWGSNALTQTGDYLFVISPAGEPGTCSVKFEAK